MLSGVLFNRPSQKPGGGEDRAETARKQQKTTGRLRSVDLSSRKKCMSNKMRQTRHAYYPTRKLISAYTRFVLSVLKTLCVYLVVKEPQLLLQNRSKGSSLCTYLSLFSALLLARPAPSASVHHRPRPWSRDLLSLFVCRPFCSFVRYPSSFVVHSGSWSEK